MDPWRAFDGRSGWILSLRVEDHDDQTWGKLENFVSFVRKHRLKNGVRRVPIEWGGKPPSTEPKPGAPIAFYWSSRGRAPKGPGIYAAGTLVDFKTQAGNAQSFRVDFDENAFSEQLKAPLLFSKNKAEFGSIGIKPGPVLSWYPANATQLSALTGSTLAPKSQNVWMYQIKPGDEFDGGRDTNTENLFGYELRKKRFKWGASQNVARARPGDTVLIRSGDKKEPGLVAVATVIETALSSNNNVIIMKPDASASGLLRRNPIPLRQMIDLVNPTKKTMPNLVDLTGVVNQLGPLLRERGLKLFPEPSGSSSTANEELLPTAVPSEGWKALESEGRLVEWQSNLRRERKPANRQRVLMSRARPWRCDACDFSFGEAFGEEFAEYIQVHHQVPIGAGERTPDPSEFDLLCANCHAIAHWLQPLNPLSLDELRAMRRKVTPSTSGSSVSQTALFAFDPRAKHFGLWLQVVLTFLYSGGPLPGEVQVHYGDLLGDSRKAVDSVVGDQVEAWVVALEGPTEAIQRTLRKWREHAPPSGLGAGIVKLNPTELGLPPFAVVGATKIVLASDSMFSESYAELGPSVLEVESFVFNAAWASGVRGVDELSALRNM